MQPGVGPLPTVRDELGWERMSIGSVKTLLGGLLVPGSLSFFFSCLRSQGLMRLSPPRCLSNRGETRSTCTWSKLPLFDERKASHKNQRASDAYDCCSAKEGASRCSVSVGWLPLKNILQGEAWSDMRLLRGGPRRWVSVAGESGGTAVS